MTKHNVPHAHSDRWDSIDNIAIAKLFAEAFGEDVTILPGQYIVDELREVGTATLELLENRSGSSVYRIRQTGVVYQILEANSDTYDYDDYDCYLADDPIDRPVTIFSDGQMPNYTVARIDADTLYVCRNNKPKFSGIWKDGELSIREVETDDPLLIAKYMRRIGLMVERFLKDEGKKE